MSSLSRARNHKKQITIHLKNNFFSKSFFLFDHKQWYSGKVICVKHSASRDFLMDLIRKVPPTGFCILKEKDDPSAPKWKWKRVWYEETSFGARLPPWSPPVNSHEYKTLAHYTVFKVQCFTLSLAPLLITMDITYRKAGKFISCKLVSFETSGATLIYSERDSEFY